MNYKNVYFRIESGYMKPTENSPAFYEEIVRLFNNAGWETSSEYRSGHGAEVVNGKNRLYIHPQSASGEVQEDLIPAIEQILSAGTTFKHYHTDIYETLFDMSDKEYRLKLEQQAEKITADILEAFKTKRSNLYIAYTWGALKNVSEKYRIPRIQRHLTRSSNDIEVVYVGELFESLYSAGKIVTANTKSGTGYRTA